MSVNPQRTFHISSSISNSSIDSNLFRMADFKMNYSTPAIAQRAALVELGPLHMFWEGSMGFDF